MEITQDTFATAAPIAEPDIVSTYNEHGYRHSWELYDDLFRAFIKDPSNREVIPDVTWDSADLMEYLKAFYCDFPNGHVLDEFWEWLLESVHKQN
jgi:hypothetical protein